LQEEKGFLKSKAKAEMVSSENLSQKTTVLAAYGKEGGMLASQKGRLSTSYQLLRLNPLLYPTLEYILHWGIRTMLFEWQLKTSSSFLSDLEMPQHRKST
jgi:hypothetical protein